MKYHALCVILKKVTIFEIVVCCKSVSVCAGLARYTQVSLEFNTLSPSISVSHKSPAAK